METSLMLSAVEDTLRRCHGRALQIKASKLAESIRKAIDSLYQPIQIAIIGRISSSKSTLVNALLGDPHAMKTDRSEETYNVCWIKNGEDTDHVRIVFKDGSSTMVDRAELDKWSSRTSGNTRKDEVAYIEVYYPSETLKHMNIIDTPGLDSMYGTDSMNTIRFISTHQPDAVIMVFSKSVSKSALDSIEEVSSVFKQNCNDFGYNLSPINSIGILGKIDETWSVDDERTALERGQSSVDSLLRSNPTLKESFYCIRPLSALLGLGAATIDASDLQTARSLADTVADDIDFVFGGVPSFLDGMLEVPIEDRRRLLEKVGLYGAYTLTMFMKQERTVEQCREYLTRLSGLDSVTDTIHTHFGERASMIKVRNLVGDILRICEEISNDGINGEDSAAEVENIAEEIRRTLSEYTDYEEWDLLSKIYSGELKLPDQISAEAKALFGENGDFICDRLALPGNTDIATIKEESNRRMQYWSAKYNICRRTNRLKDMHIAKLMSLAYTKLVQRIEMVEMEIAKKERELKFLKRFLYG